MEFPIKSRAFDITKDANFKISNEMFISMLHYKYMFILSQMMNRYTFQQVFIVLYSNFILKSGKKKIMVKHMDIYWI